MVSPMRLEEMLSYRYRLYRLAGDRSACQFEFPDWFLFALPTCTMSPIYIQFSMLLLLFKYQAYCACDFKSTRQKSIQEEIQNLHGLKNKVFS